MGETWGKEGGDPPMHRKKKITPDVEGVYKEREKIMKGEGGENLTR